MDFTFGHHVCQLIFDVWWWCWWWWWWWRSCCCRHRCYKQGSISVWSTDSALSEFGYFKKGLLQPKPDLWPIGYHRDRFPTRWRHPAPMFSIRFFLEYFMIAPSWMRFLEMALLCACVVHPPCAAEAPPVDDSRKPNSTEQWHTDGSCSGNFLFFFSDKVQFSRLKIIIIIAVVAIYICFPFPWSSGLGSDPPYLWSQRVQEFWVRIPILGLYYRGSFYFNQPGNWQGSVYLTYHIYYSLF